VNQRVQVWARGCLTLKFSGSWKTVTTSPEFAVGAESEAASPPSGEMGMVSRGTGEVATSAMMRWIEGEVGVERYDGCLCDKKVIEKELSRVSGLCESSCQTEGATRCAALLLSSHKRECDGACRLDFSHSCLQLHLCLPVSL
jgi:hypothetical protein